MRCEKCKKNKATVRMEQSSSGMKKDIYLCDECSGDMEISMILENIFKELFQKIYLVPIGALKNLTSSGCKFACRNCGVTFDELKSGGFLGCTTCYQDFADVLKPFLEGSHGSTTHEGKYPKRGGASLEREKQILKLRFLLDKSIEEEDFEQAAFLRDKIRVLNTAGEDSEEV